MTVIFQTAMTRPKLRHLSGSLLNIYFVFNFKNLNKKQRCECTERTDMSCDLDLGEVFVEANSNRYSRRLGILFRRTLNTKSTMLCFKSISL